MRRSGLLTLLLGCLAVALSGCGSNCRALNELLCRCNAPTSTEVQFCYAQVRADESRLEPTAEDQEVCGQKLETCTCEGLDTPEGKVACGLAR